MKTFKLKFFNIMLNQSEEIVDYVIPLIDGLIINREDEDNRWVIEAYIDKKYMDFFNELKETNEEIIVQVKITKETNEPATLITDVIAVNALEEEMNVILMGTIIDEQKTKIEKVLTELIHDGYSGEQLLEKFKTMV
ncbi:MAG TPA: hypothetical protein IAA78_02190 [Candidatus Avamphibacillus intestinigallinarum]|nr:hypothetical protein [Candidatus Avamphibacillus intestinigallinarum]